MSAEQTVAAGVLVDGLAAVIGVVILELITIVVIKLRREKRDRIEAITRTALTTDLIEALDTQSAMTIPAPHGLIGFATCQTIVGLIAVIGGSARAQLIALLEDHGYVGQTARHLKSRDAATRARGCMTLGGMLSQRAETVLLDRFYNDRNANVRLTAAEALADIGNPQTSIILIAALKSASDPQRLRIANAISRMGKVAVPALVEALADLDETIVRLALDILCDIASVPDYSSVIRLLSHPSAEVRGRAVDLLGIVGAIDAVAYVIDETHDPVWFVRVRAIKSLQRMGAPDDSVSAERYFSALETLLLDEAWWVRQHAAQALANSGERGNRLLRASVSDAAVSALQLFAMREASA